MTAGGDRLGGTFDPAPVLAYYRHCDDTETAEHLGVSAAAVNRWRTSGSTMRADTADHIANRLGLHPLNLWPDWGHVEPDPLERTCTRCGITRPYESFRPTGLGTRKSQCRPCEAARERARRSVMAAARVRQGTD